MAEYYTYKSQVPLKAGEKLGFTPGRGYYAIPAPAPAKAPVPASTEELGGLSPSRAEEVATSYGLTTPTTTTQTSEKSTKATSSAASSAPPTKHATQPSKAPTTAAKTPTAAEDVAKAATTDPYRPTVFKASTKAKANAALLEAAHRQGGTVARPMAAAKTTKPATANTKKQPATPVKTTVSASTKKPGQTATVTTGHPAASATPSYYTYKKDVHLKPGQTLAYTPGRGYYARAVGAAPTVTTGAGKGASTGVLAARHGLTTTRSPKGQRMPESYFPPVAPSPLGGKSKTKRSAPTSGRGKVVVTASGKSVSHRGPTLRVGDTTVTTTFHAGAKLSWSRGKGKGKVTVSINPHTKGISVQQGPLTLSDNGKLNEAAKSYEPSPFQAAIGVLTDGTTPHAIKPYKLDLRIGGKDVPVEFGTVHVSIEGDADIQQGAGTVTVEISTPFKASTKSYGEVEGDYSLTFEMKITRTPNRTPGLPVDILALALALALQQGEVIRTEPALGGASAMIP